MIEVDSYSPWPKVVLNFNWHTSAPWVIPYYLYNEILRFKLSDNQ